MNFVVISDPSIAKKDLNIIKSGDKILLAKPFSEIISSQIQKDCVFFEQNNIIDYSLLIGIHHLNPDHEKFDYTEKTSYCD